MTRRFFYDCEFMEEPGFLELISIGVVDESGEQHFYACNLDADLTRANDWVKENVISQLPDKGDEEQGYNPQWQKMDDIRENLLEFLEPSEKDPIELWGDYSAYDHVMLCWIFGRMVDLPKGMPMHTMDIRQELLSAGVSENVLPPDPKGVHDALVDAVWNREAWLLVQESMETGDHTGSIVNKFFQEKMDLQRKNKKQRLDFEVLERGIARERHEFKRKQVGMSHLVTILMDVRFGEGGDVHIGKDAFVRLGSEAAALRVDNQKLQDDLERLKAKISMVEAEKLSHKMALQEATGEEIAKLSLKCSKLQSIVDNRDASPVCEKDPNEDLGGKTLTECMRKNDSFPPCTRTGIVHGAQKVKRSEGDDPEKS